MVVCSGRKLEGATIRLIKSSHSKRYKQMDWLGSRDRQGETVMDVTNWPELTKNLSAELRNLRGGAPEVMKAFSSIAQAALAEGALDPKTKELIALGISVAVRCDDCIAFHVKAAVERGATREEVLETLGMAIYMGAGPSAMYASRALGAYNQFAEAKAKNANA